jgi:hypothetical protein
MNVLFKQSAEIKRVTVKLCLTCMCTCIIFETADRISMQHDGVHIQMVQRYVKKTSY